MLSGNNGLLTRAGDAKEKTVTAQEEENAKLTFTEVQMELAQGKTVESDQFQKMVDGNFGTGNATGTIGGNSYIITVARTGINYQMDSNGNIGTLDELPIDFNPGELEKSGDTYTINSIEDLVAFSYNVNSGTESYEGKTVTLGRNLDFQDDNSYVDASSKYKKDDNGYILDTSSTSTIKELMTSQSEVGFIPIGYDSDSNNTFKGNFDGKGKSLINLYMKTNGLGGIFGSIANEVEISNLSISSCNINGIYPTGAIVGDVRAKLTIINCHISGKVESNYAAGGFVGMRMNNSDLTLSNCSNDAEISGGISPTGGLIGADNNYFTNAIKIVNCCNTGTVNSTGSNTGGILGFGSIEIRNCYNAGDIKSSVDSTNTGGL